MLNFYQMIVVMVISMCALPVCADDDFIQWHTTNIQLLRGFDYQLGSEDRTIVTLEHANRWRYGDFHFFADQTFPDSGDQAYYFETTLRFSLSKITNQNLSYGVLKDILLSTNMEKPKHQKRRLLGGVSADFHAPGFTFLKTNLWLRDNPNLRGSTYQFTTAWNRPFTIGGVSGLAEGFADFAGSEGRTVSHQLIVPRVLFDVGALVADKKNTLWLGVEWSYWHNKFGVDGVTESVPQLQAKWVF